MGSTIEEAVAALESGMPVIFPTDTVYGIGVSVRHAHDLQKLYEIKERDAGKPVAWLVAGPEALDEFGVDVPQRARELARENWPGALTVIVKASPSVPRSFCAQSGTIGLRMPDNETALTLMKAVGGPLATSSANFSGKTAPREYAELDGKLLAKVSAALQDDLPRSGVASTVIDCSSGAIRVIREGGVVVS